MKTLFICLLFTFSLTCLYAQKIPYSIDKKPIPTGTNWTRILPKKFSKYTLINFKTGSDLSSFSAEYADENVRFQLTGYYRSLGEINLLNLPPPPPIDPNEPKSPCKEENGDNHQLTVCPDFAAFSYDKGNSRIYHFSITAKNRQELDSFMKMFPY